ncbi:amidohydrolase 2 [Guyanagaster necrorhizus]|uniref:Amidohydrolase 2 n=1 Tax=Guyanagaster necrorhizus TaxID=856835 RepID=A0A9P8ATS7_9AGAR|nr:amidohydrolase 2 [Guyanagaster necrorhizus MCA 3950]KAG7447321.1 amidohydrolase 2 [Guyanagaster necrorhizus MCA 3950]
MKSILKTLIETTKSYPVIDNHAHPLLTAENKASFPLEALFTEAEGDAIKDSVHSLSCFRATAQLGQILGLDEPSWDDIKKTRNQMDYGDLCNLLMRPTRIQCLLLDDGLGGVAEMAEDWTWHRQFNCSVKRIVRIETEAEAILVRMVKESESAPDLLTLANFTQQLHKSLSVSAASEQVVAFKSIACYRTGLNIATWNLQNDLRDSFTSARQKCATDGKIRLAHKPFNDHIIRVALEIAGEHNIPVQFHTGLGDNDISLAFSSPSYLQPIIKACPKTQFVLLHSSYPYTRDAGYLTLVYANVFLDFGEIFPMVSAHGQRAVIRQMLEITPTNKILWSTDGHWFPETYYLGTLQARTALCEVLSELVTCGDLTENQAVKIVQDVLFHNSNRVYNLGLEPNLVHEEK